MLLKFYTTTCSLWHNQGFFYDLHKNPWDGIMGRMNFLNAGFLLEIHKKACLKSHLSFLLVTSVTYIIHSMLITFSVLLVVTRNALILCSSWSCWFVGGSEL